MAMNSYRTEADPNITDADFRLMFPEIQLSIEPSMITIRQHCEISIALGIPAELSPSEPFAEIGISKHNCWLWEHFSSCLESISGHKFAVTAGYGYNQQGKVHAGGGGRHYLVEAAEAIRNSLHEILHKELGELRGMGRS